MRLIELKGGKSVRWVACNELAGLAKRGIIDRNSNASGYSDLKNLLQLSWRRLPAGFLSDERIATLKNGGIFVRTTKDQLNLPEVSFEEIPIIPSNIQSQVYSALKRSYMALKLSYERTNVSKRGGL